MSLPAMKIISNADRTTRSLCGEFRERIGAAHNTDLGRDGVGGNSYLLQYATVSAEIESHDLLHVVLQLGSWVSTGREPEHAATVDDSLDIAQAYVDLHAPVWDGGSECRLHLYRHGLAAAVRRATRHRPREQRTAGQAHRALT